MPLLSIVTPTFDAGRWLPHCLDSVAALGVDHEHVVVDGGSADGTVELLRARDDPRLRWVSEPDRGQTHAVNKGLALAEGELLMWVNGDDEVVPEGVERAVEHLQRHPEVDVVYGGLDFMDEHGTVHRPYRPGPWDWRRFVLYGTYVPTPTFVFRAARARAVGPLDERWADAADYDFYLRLTHRARVVGLPDAHVRFRWHADSKTASNVHRQLDEAQAIRLAWAPQWRTRLAMTALDRATRALAGPLTGGRWPAPF